MSTSLESGGVVGGYRIESLLGRGGMAAVYLAEDGRLKRKVALKVLSPELAADEAFRRRFVDESERLASVDHPNIIPVYEAGQDNGHLFIAMRYVDSTDLKKLIASEGRLSPERAASIVTQVAGALDAAHSKGLVHRDVKPANVLVAVGSGGDGSDHAYLSDFGLTKRTQETSGLTKTGFFMGTIDYVAPEQIGGSGVDGRTDQYALACVLFECLTGRTPYSRDDDAAVLYSHLSEPPPSVTEAVPGLPRAIDAVLAGGMAKEKNDRYSSCLEFARAARSALLDPSGETVVEPSATPSPGVPFAHTPTVIAAPALVEEPSPKRRGRRIAIVVGAVILALGVVAGGLALLSGGGDAGRTTL
ncbi:MAG TPA: serine/threonine-protein kinase, partial [Actinomycetota bacterium]|nr:serine/threonine-protein kinase [Actinomycetota bacterium]